MSVFAQLHIKKELSNRFIVCAACIRATDDHLGYSHSTRTCARCLTPLEVGVVVSEPRPARKK